MDFKFNVNNYAKVKLTENGINILRRRHEELNKRLHEIGAEGFGEFNLKLDDEGYYVEQLCTLMQIFGLYMSNGATIPFETNIILVDGN